MTSGEKRSKGLLTMAATHLGNAQDIPVRSLDALRGADLLIFEEDKPARSFLKAAGVIRGVHEVLRARPERDLRRMHPSAKAKGLGLLHE